ncbi:MAG: hypothetical protein IJI14_05595 [Anaerolineaceae bacterium]|nr:hypothetical protein [Anaerolineaceae bacterium]
MKNENKKNDNEKNKNESDTSRDVKAIDGKQDNVLPESESKKENSQQEKLSPSTDLINGVQYVIDHYEEITQARKLLAERLVPVIDAVREATSYYAEKLNKIDYDAIAEFAHKISDFQQNLKNIINSIHIPSISDERKAQLFESHRKWGEYGWTLDPNGGFDELFNTPPKDKKDADAKSLKCLKEPELLFQKTYSYKKVKKSDFTEAINDFNDKRYKSCALILLSLIDAHLIRFQKMEKTQRRWRDVGINAVSKAKNRIGFKEHHEWLFLAMYYENLFACLEKIFESGNDFKNQPSIINRNFLDHGMSTQPIRRKDCIQLFLLYCNVLEMLELARKVKK